MENGFNPAGSGTRRGSVFLKVKVIDPASLETPLLVDDELLESGTSISTLGRSRPPDVEESSLATKLTEAIEVIVRDQRGSAQSGSEKQSKRDADLRRAFERLGLGGLGAAVAQLGAEDITAARVHELIFTRRALTGSQVFALRALTWVMPFLYTIVTRLPFICLALEVAQREGVDWHLGLLLGSYQTCRALANVIISKCGGRSPMHRLHIPMVVLSVLGWLLVNPQILPFDSVWHLFLLCLVGLSECVLNLQTAVVNDTAAEYPSGIADKDLLEGRIRGQYAAVAGGAAVAFVAGGQLYERLGFDALCWFGLGCALAHLALALFYRKASLYQPTRGGSQAAADSTSPLGSCYQIIALSYLIQEANAMNTKLSIEMQGRLPLDVLTNLAVRAKEDKVLHNSLKELYQAATRDNVADEEPRRATRRMSKHNVVAKEGDIMAKLYQCAVQLMDVDNNGELSLREFVSYLGPRVYHQIHGDTSNEVDVIWPYMHFVVATQAIVAFCIGSFLSTALLMYTNRFGLDAGISGLLLGIGEGAACGSIFLAYFLKQRKEQKVHQGHSDTTPGGMFAAMKSRPLHVPITVCMVSIGTICFSIPSLPVAIIAQMLMSTFNDVSVSYLNELIATSVPPHMFRKYQGRGQALRRIGNVITGVTGPILFGVYQGFPFLLFGGIVFVWSLILGAAIYKQAVTMDKALNKETQGKGPLGPFMSTIATPWHQLEKEYYTLDREAIKDELGYEDEVTEDIPELKITVKRLTASLGVEKTRLRILETELEELKDKFGS